MSKPPLPSAEVARGDVHHHLVAHLVRARSAPRRRPPGRSSPSTSTVSSRAVDGDDGAAPQREPLHSTSVSATSSALSSASTVTNSSGSWLCAVPFATFRQGRPVRVEDVRVAAAAGGHVLAARSRALSSAAAAVDDRRRRARDPVGAELLLDVGLDVALGVAAPRRSARRPSARPRASALSGSTLRASSSSRQRSATTFAAVPPSIRPTFAVVSSSIRPELHPRQRVRRRDDRAAAVLRPDARRAPRARGTRPRSGSSWARPRSARRSARRGRRRSRSRPAARRGRTPSRPASATSSQVVKRNSSPTGAIGREPARDAHERRHGRLVVGAEDRLEAVRVAALGLLDLDRPGQRDRVEVRAEEDRRRALGPRDARVAGCPRRRRSRPRSRPRSARARSRPRRSPPPRARGATGWVSRRAGRSPPAAARARPGVARNYWVRIRGSASALVSPRRLLDLGGALRVRAPWRRRRTRGRAAAAAAAAT